MRGELAQHGSLIDERREAGKVRRCHGDLHLRNICLVDGRPVLFDCVEFSEDLASIDVLYDLSQLSDELLKSIASQMKELLLPGGLILLVNHFFLEFDPHSRFVSRTIRFERATKRCPLCPLMNRPADRCVLGS
jgi:hypothetical protein